MARQLINTLEAAGCAFHRGRPESRSVHERSKEEYSMAVALEKTLRRELLINGRSYVIAISPQGLKLTLKRKRKGLELHWDALVSGDAALVRALNASLKLLPEGASARGGP